MLFVLCEGTWALTPPPEAATEAQKNGIDNDFFGCSFISEFCWKDGDLEAPCQYVKELDKHACVCPPGSLGDGLAGVNNTGCRFRKSDLLLLLLMLLLFWRIETQELLES